MLLKNLYGSIWAPKLFSNLLYNWFEINGFQSNPQDPCVWTRFDKEGPLHIIAHVDDLGAVGTRAQVDRFYEAISNKKTGFSITRHGRLGIEAERYLGIEVKRVKEPRDEFHLRNTTLINNLLERVAPFMSKRAKEDVPMRDVRLSKKDAVPPTDEDECKRARPPHGPLDERPYRSFVGGIGYIMLSTRPDLAFAYKELSSFNSNYGEAHWDALLRCLSYLDKTRDMPLVLTKSGSTRLEAYVDSDWNGNVDEHKSTTGYIIFLGDAPISWCSQMQGASARSVCESEYIALSHCAQELVYLQMFAKSLRLPDNERVDVRVNQGTNDTSAAPDGHGSALRVWEEFKQVHGIPADETAMCWSDSQNAIANAKTPFGWLSGKLRHLHTAFHFVKQYVLKNESSAWLRLRACDTYGTSAHAFKLDHVRGDDNPADIFTKGFGDATAKATNNQRAATFQRHMKFCLGLRAV